MEIELPALEMRGLTLTPRVERGMGAATAAPLRDAITLGGPIAVPLTTEYLDGDPELRSFVEADAEHRYHLVHLAGTFFPADGEPLERVWIAIELWGPDPEFAPRPIAWSMKPEAQADEGARSSGVSLGTDLKILKLGFEQGATQVSREVSLQALYALQSNPTWVLERTAATEIYGSQRFVLVVQSPRDVASRGRVEVGAIVRRRRFGLLTHKVQLSDLPEPLEFALSE